jgi:acetyl/propionyl-CoA carboxylase alpha subunit
MPSGPGVRVDSGVEAGTVVRPEYDNLVAKLLVVAADRPAAIDRLRRALDEVSIDGIQTTLPLYRRISRDPSFRAGDLSTEWLAGHWDGPGERGAARHVAAVVAGLTALDRVQPAFPDGRLAGGESAWRSLARREAVERRPE